METDVKRGLFEMVITNNDNISIVNGELAVKSNYVELSLYLINDGQLSLSRCIYVCTYAA